MESALEQDFDNVYEENQNDKKGLELQNIAQNTIQENDNKS